MELNVKEISASEKEVEVKLDYDEIKDEIQKEVKKQAKKIQIPGFRKGKVPPQVLKKMFGDTLEYEASEKVANKQFWNIADEKDLKPIGRPTMTDIDFEPGKNLNFKVKYEIIPEIEVKDYKDQELEIPDFQVKEEEVEKEIDYILKANSTKEDAEATTDEKNFILDVEVIRVDDDGKPLEESKPEKLEIDLSDERVSPEILESTKNKKVGDTFTFSFNDERTQKNEKGEEEKISEKYSYEGKILGIKTVVAPELNEELIKRITKDKVTNETDLRNQIKKDIQGYYDKRIEEFTRAKLISTIIEKNDFTPPSSLVNNILDEYVKNEEEKAKQEGVRFYDKEEARKRLSKSAENEVKWYILKNEIQKREGIKVDEEDLKKMAEKDAEKTGLPVDKLLNYYKSSNQGERLIDQKLFDFLKEKNNIKKVDPDKLSNSKKEEKNEG